MEFCCSDIDIPRRFCLKFKKTNGRSVQPGSMQILCNHSKLTSLREHFLEEDTISIIPSESYQQPLEYSVLALQWLSWIYNETGHRIFYTLKGGALHVMSTGLWLGHAKCLLLDTLNALNEAS